MKRLMISLAVVAAGATYASACSVCIAHAFGAALHGLGGQVLEKGHGVVGITFLGFDKTSGTDAAGGVERERYRQTSLDAYYGLSDQAMLRLSVPYVTKRIGSNTDPTESANGLGDTSVGVTYQLKPRLNDKVLWSVSGDVKLPTGKNNAKDSNGDFKDQHLQVGTGSTDFQLGLTATMEAPQDALFFAGLGARFNGSNDRHYKYGDAIFYNVGYSRPIAPLTLGVLEFNGRIAKKDRTEDGSPDENSGGHLGYLSFSIRRSVGQGYGLIVGYE